MKKLRFDSKNSRKQRYLILGSIILFFLFIPPRVSANNSLQSRVNLNFKNTKLANVIDYIEANTRYRFLYQSSDLNLDKSISIRYQGKIQGVVNTLFKNTNIEALISGNQIILKKKLEREELLEISGIVSDEYGEVLPGANVLINDFERGTSTDENGAYKIKAHKGDKISFYFVGFEELNYTIKNKNTINVTLKEDLSILEEVVIGYEKIKKSKVSGAISSVRGETIQENIQTGVTFDKGLDGLMKGVFITQGTGELGKNADVIIRGITSPFSGSNNNPLYIIDGVAVTTPNGLATNSGYGFNPLEAINSNDIESIEVLKDASATAIYGSRGANGVIIVKTKTGQYNQPTTVRLSANSTFGTPIKTLNYLNATDFKKHILTLNQNSLNHYKSGVDPDYSATLENLPHFGFSIDPNTEKIIYNPSNIKFGSANTDWNKEVYRNLATTNKYNVTVNGGAEKISYGLSLGHTSQEGVLKADKRKQYNSRLNTQFNIFHNLKVAASVNYVNSKQNTGYNNTNPFAGFNSLGSALRFRPDIPVYDKNGNFTFTTHGSGVDRITTVNPVGMTTLSSQRELINNSILSNVFAEYNITDNLMFKVDYSYSTYFSDSDDYKPKKYGLTGYNQFSSTELFVDNTKSTSSVINYILNYNKVFNNHHFTSLLGYLFIYRKYFTHTKINLSKFYFQFNSPTVF